MEKTSMICQLSITFKESIDQYATKNGMSTSELIRKTLADAIGYDLDAENANRVETRGRPRKYNTDAERKAEANRKAKERYDLGRRLLEDHQRQQRRRDAANMEASVTRKDRKDRIASQ